MVEMSPVELLRAAAARVREIAASASSGPWETGGDGLVWPPRMGDPVSGSTEPEDAAWIALMHPGLAEPLAASLEYCYETYKGWLTWPLEAEQAYQVARVLLGVPDGR